MSNCYPQRVIKTNKIQKSLCGKCINHLKIKFIKLRPFWYDDLIQTAKDIKENKVFTHDQGCKYLYLGKSTLHDVDCIIVTECNHFKNKNMKKVKKDPAGYGNNAVNSITGRSNAELNRDGGGSCSNPNWGTGNKGDANPDTQKELTAIQKYELHQKN